jgi:hypothetical protein
MSMCHYRIFYYPNHICYLLIQIIGVLLDFDMEGGGLVCLGDEINVNLRECRVAKVTRNSSSLARSYSAHEIGLLADTSRPLSAVTWTSRAR